ncbi:multisubunit potassium/proton antiporter, PhaG subunit [Pseudoxanthomonas sp. GM95]|uniref:Na+/H+ antiporter subunit G n=1 Tax=Pseudoxanthomonas sp. GM95 TaxID=1881043 RepID=UPI0008C72624|nr:Na+/H+ antiporter subunit G [Pseudoxanthomonas sp. GM95]SEK40415.1 multisubunit potassium/proton antiporter, PhaG subunit [Pseudoxanthomonas sp. GM95]
MSAFFDLALIVLLVAGSVFILVGALGLVKLSDVFRRLHAPTKSSTLGVGCVLLASMGYHLLRGEGLQLRELLITVFLFITAPISAHLIAKAALALLPRQRPEPPAKRD